MGSDPQNTFNTIIPMVVLGELRQSFYKVYIYQGFFSTGSAAWHCTAALAKPYSDATYTSTTSLPLSLTILCPWDYPPVYIGIYRRSPVVRFVGGSYILCMWYFSCSSSLSVPYGGSNSVLGRFYLFSWFAGFTRFSLMSSSSILGCQSRVSLICASGSIFLFVL